MLAFVHIPKTAGTTLHKIITQQYPKNRIFIYHDADQLSQAAIESQIRRTKPQAILGHFSVGLHEVIPDIRYITCIRNPISRIISHYHHALNDPAHYLHSHIIKENWDPAQYVSSGLSGELSNGMTRMLAGLRDFHNARVDSSTLDLAKHNLQTLFDGIILSESFDSGLLLVTRKLGWNSPYYIRRKVGNYASTHTPINTATKNVIESHNQLDCELFEWARQRQEALCSKFTDLKLQTARFQRKNRIIGKTIFCAREIKLRLF